MRRAPKRLAALVAVLAGLACGPADDRPDIVLITLDTTRADHLGVYGYPRPTTPRLDAFAEHALVYERALSSATWTLPAHASLFTGELPSAHGARFDPEGGLRLAQAIRGEGLEYLRVRTISEAEPTLAGLLREAGYGTGAVVAGPWMLRQFGLDAGFDHYDDEGIRSLGGRWGRTVTRQALAWLDATPQRPRFLFLNYFDAHGPLDPPQVYLEMLEHAPLRPLPERTPEDLPRDTLARYDAELRYQDAALGALFDGLRERGLFEDAWIWITADHGELFGEHGETGHGNLPYRSVVRVPLLVKAPGPDPPAGRVRARVQITDIAPTILSQLGLPLPDGVQGRPLPGLAPGAAPAGEGERALVVESRTLPIVRHRGSWRALYLSGWKLVWNSLGRHRLFDLSADPRERRDLFDARPEVAQRMRARLERELASLPEPGPPPPSREVDPETREALRAVGYLE